MCDLIPNFGKWFPSASYLRLMNLNFPKKNKEKLAPNNCRALRQLYIHPTKVTGESEFYAQWETDFVILNPQLTKLSVPYHARMLDVPSLPTLHLEIFFDRFLALDRLSSSFIYFDKLERLTLHGVPSRNHVTANKIGTLDIYLTHLKNSDLLHFVKKECSIKNINIIRKWHPISDPNKVIDVIKQIKNLKELSLPSHCSISTKKIVELVTRCTTLNYLFIYADEELAEYSYIKEKLGTEWVKTRETAITQNVIKHGFLFIKMSTKT